MMMHGGNILQQLCNSMQLKILNYSCNCDHKRLVMLSSFCWMLMSLFSSKDTCCAWSLAIASSLRGRKDIGVSHNGYCKLQKMHWRSFPLLAIHTTFQLADHCNCTRPWFILSYSYLHVLTFLLVCALCFWMCPHSCVGLHHTPALTVSQYCHPSLNILILDIQRKVLDGEFLLSKDLRKTFVKENRFRHLRYNNYVTH